MKRCQTCKEEKPLGQFYNSKITKDKLYPRCKDCDRKARHLWDVNNPERSKYSKSNKRLKHIYGISLEDYERFLKDQDYICKICGGLEVNRRLAVDHCHETNKIRGLLCSSCNRAIGLLKDNPSLLRKAADYLEVCDPLSKRKINER